MGRSFRRCSDCLTAIRRMTAATVRLMTIRCQALYSACKLMYMNDFLDRAGGDIWGARKTLDACMWRASVAAKKAEKKGIPETVIAEKLGVSRMTVRKWLGK